MIILFIALLGGVICSVIAAARRRSALGWFVIGFLFPVIGLILILVLPPSPMFDEAQLVPTLEPGPWQVEQQQLAARKATQTQSLEALASLAALKERGALTEAEFEDTKATLLARV